MYSDIVAASRVNKSSPPGTPPLPIAAARIKLGSDSFPSIHGAVATAAADTVVPVPPPSSGMLFGCLVWAGPALPPPFDANGVGADTAAAAAAAAFVTGCGGNDAGTRREASCNKL